MNNVIDQLGSGDNIVNIKNYLSDNSTVNYELEIISPVSLGESTLKDHLAKIFDVYHGIKKVAVTEKAHHALPERYRLSLILGALFMAVMVFFSIPLRV